MEEREHQTEPLRHNVSLKLELWSLEQTTLWYILHNPIVLPQTVAETDISSSRNSYWFPTQPQQTSSFRGWLTSPCMSTRARWWNLGLGTGATANPGHLLRSFHQMKSMCCNFSLQPQPRFQYVPPLLFHRLSETSPTSTPATQHDLALAPAPLQWNTRPLIAFQHSANKPPLPSPWKFPSFPQLDTNSQSFQFQNLCSLHAGFPVSLPPTSPRLIPLHPPSPHAEISLERPLLQLFSFPPLFPSWFLSRLVKMYFFVHCYSLVTQTRFWSPVRTSTLSALLP